MANTESAPLMSSPEVTTTATLRGYYPLRSMIVPFAGMFVNCCLMDCYTGLKRLWQVLIPNVVGALMATVAFVAFVARGAPSDRIFYSTVVAVCVVLFALVVSIACFLVPRDEELDVAGTATLVAGLAMFASPILVIKDVCVRRDASPLFFWPALGMLASCATWTIYAVAIGDRVVGVPNGVGAVVAVAQLTILGLHRRQTCLFYRAPCHS